MSGCKAGILPSKHSITYFFYKNVLTSKAEDTCTVTQEPRPHRMCSPAQNPLIKGGCLQIASEVTCIDLFHDLHILT